MVGSRKDGKWVYYRLEKENPDFQELIQWLKREFENSRLVQADRRMLDEIGPCDKIEMCRKQRRKSKQ